MRDRVGLSLALALATMATACGDASEAAPAGSTSSAGGAGQGAGGSTGGAGAGAAGGAGAMGGMPAGGDGGLGGAGAGPPTPADTRCGLDFDWLPASSVGSLVGSETPQSTLTVLEAQIAKLALASEGLELERSVDHETLAHRIVYTTQDRGEPREATALVIVPQVSGAETFPVIVWHHGTTGLTDACAPSAGIEDSDSTNFAVALVLSIISSFGYIIVAPDYLGQKSVGAPSTELHPYLVGEPTAIAAWDSVRAAQALLAQDGSQAAAGPVVLWGASQGGHAALFTAVYHEHYAPEQDLRAGVYVVPPSDLQAHIAWGTRELRSSTGNAALFYAAIDDWYDPSPGLSEVFVAPLDVDIPAALAAECSPDDLDGVSSVDEVFTPALIAASQGAGIAGYEPWTCYAEQASLTTSLLEPPAIPGLFILAENDGLVDSALERLAFQSLCAKGHSLTFRECAGAEHEEGFTWSIDDALDYMDARIAGQPLDPAQVCELALPTTCSNTP